MDIRDLFDALWARKLLAILLVLVTIGTAVVMSLVVPKEYTATSMVLLDVQSPDRIVGMVLPGMNSPSYMATQMDIADSYRVALRAAEILLNQHPDLIPGSLIGEQQADQLSPETFVPALAQGLRVRPSGQSHVIEIKFTSPSAAFSAASANAFADAFIDTTVELRAEPARKYADWFERQFNQYRDRLERAQNGLSLYQEQQGVLITDDRLDVEIQRLSMLVEQLSVAQEEGTDSASKQSIAEDQDTLPEVMRNPVIIELRKVIMRSESNLKELTGELGLNHPDYLSAKRELESMKERLQIEIRRIADSIATQGRVSLARAADISSAIEQQKSKMLALREQKDRIKVLTQDVELAQRALDAVTQRWTQSQLEAAAVQTNASILVNASAPDGPSKPLPLINAVIAALLGSILAAGVVVCLELMRPLVRSRHNLENALEVPVLCELGNIQAGK